MSELYLNEENLGEFLKLMFKDQKIIHNKGLPENTRIRPDYLLPDLKLIFEFNGPLHYTLSKTVKKDLKRIPELESYGYKVVEIPFYVQLSFSYLYHLNVFTDEQLSVFASQPPTAYPDGFIVAKVLPADFCIAGYKRFLKEFKELPKCIRDGILKSLKAKADELGDVELVVPSRKMIEKVNKLKVSDGYRIIFNLLNGKDTEVKYKPMGIDDFWAAYSSKYNALSYEEFNKALCVFEEWTMEAFTGGSMWSRTQAMFFLFLLTEDAGNVFKSIDSVHSIT